MRKMLKRLLIVAALVSSLVAVGGRHASADELCVRAATTHVEAIACLPIV